ncbi:MAG TPA: DUF3592 domain-containing protein [Spirochaetota bacterium]|nr:DUF3592 domain-containing protein [Spirochaetota bacterium]
MKALLEFITSFDDIGVTLWFVIPGIIGLLIGFTSQQYAKDSKTWPETEGRIISVSIEKDSSTGLRTPGGGHSSGHTSYTPVIKYEYHVRGKKHVATNLSIGNASYSDQRKARKILEEFRVGQYVTVYYKPDNPEFAVLKRGSVGIPISLIIGASFTALSMPLFLIALCNRLKRVHVGFRE